MRDLASIQFTTRMVVLGDLLFTTPAGIVQILSGLLLINELGYDYSEPWLFWALVLFVFAGICWLPVVWMQIKMRDMARAASDIKDLPPQYWQLDRLWIS